MDYFRHIFFRTLKSTIIWCSRLDLVDKIWHCRHWKLRMTVALNVHILTWTLETNLLFIFTPNTYVCLIILLHFGQWLYLYFGFWNRGTCILLCRICMQFLSGKWVPGSVHSFFKQIIWLSNLYWKPLIYYLIIMITCKLQVGVDQVFITLDENPTYLQLCYSVRNQLTIQFPSQTRNKYLKMKEIT